MNGEHPDKQAHLPKEKETIHAMTASFRNFCGGRGNVTSLVKNARSRGWGIVNCRRCLKLRPKRERYRI